jgi:hypothetical protein
MKMNGGGGSVGGTRLMRREEKGKEKEERKNEACVHVPGKLSTRPPTFRRSHNRTALGVVVRIRMVMGDGPRAKIRFPRTWNLKPIH